ncbi:hypothetical protein [Cardiobacterium valvarum]|uniref:Uncharacterized protein n=1 Tax=Cardiobacterium valvarum TaxID=194702 RepID=A0A381E326_9GAMM|nr:hypothetical protein [Cardiobacterium valvarum]SUX20389.1 Uncharacterised protein [Cardiobacterium valvarum]SUX21194.1 Uncharacterised protein [Cardiobacterium valvarum]
MDDITRRDIEEMFSDEVRNDLQSEKNLAKMPFQKLQTPYITLLPHGRICRT